MIEEVSLVWLKYGDEDYHYQCHNLLDCIPQNSGWGKAKRQKHNQPKEEVRSCKESSIRFVKTLECIYKI